jgi:hypothetical protein
LLNKNQAMLRLLSFVLALVVAATSNDGDRVCPNQETIEQSLVKVHVLHRRLWLICFLRF